MEEQFSVYSEPGNGTVFYVYLPALKEDIPEEKEETFSILRGKGKILLVDDEEGLVESGKDLLELAGYEVSGFTSSIEALEKFSLNPAFYDLVITDKAMPDLSGIKLAEKLINMRKDIPVILCTGFDDIDGKEKCKEIGIKETLLKPVEYNVFLKKIKKVMKNGNGRCAFV